MHSRPAEICLMTQSVPGHFWQSWKTVFANVLYDFVYLAQHRATDWHPQWFPVRLVGRVELCSSAALLRLVPQATGAWISKKRHFKRLMTSCGAGECKGYLFLSKSCGSLLAGLTHGGRVKVLPAKVLCRERHFLFLLSIPGESIW